MAWRLDSSTEKPRQLDLPAPDRQCSRRLRSVRSRSVRSAGGQRHPLVLAGSRSVPLRLLGRMMVDGRNYDVVMRSDARPWSDGKPPKAVRQYPSCCWSDDDCHRSPPFTNRPSRTMTLMIGQNQNLLDTTVLRERVHYAHFAARRMPAAKANTPVTAIAAVMTLRNR